MIEGWTYKKLGEVATFINGYPFKPSDWKDSGRKIIRIQNLNNPDAVYNYYDGDIDTKYIVSNGDVLISWSGSLGVYEWSDDEAILNQHIFKVVFNKGEINKRLFEYVVSSRINEMKTKVHGITMQHITKRDFDVIPIPVPPLPEQQRIVSELDLLSSIIEKKKAQLKEYDQLAQSIFYDMFGDPITNEKGWEVKKLGEVCEVTSSKRIFANEYTSSGIPFYRGKEITEKSKGMPLSIELYISEEMYKELKSIGIPQIGDVLITAVGTIGNIWVVNDNTPFYFKDGNVIWLKNIRMQNSVYFKFILEKLIEIYKQEMVRGAAYNALTIVNLKKMLVFLPPLTLQQQFAEKIEAIEKQKELIKQSITETETLFNSRMDYYFN